MALFILACLFPVIAAPAHAASLGEGIGGRVIDRSRGQEFGVPHLLVVWVQNRGSSGHVVAQAVTDADGRFSFRHVPRAQEKGSVILTSYQGVRYAVPVQRTAPSHRLILAVYDATSSDTGLIAPRVQIGMTRVRGGVAVIEDWLLANARSPARTDRGSGPLPGQGAARLPLPARAQHVVVRYVEQGASAIVAGGAVVLNDILLPATGLNAASFHEVIVEFLVPSTRSHPTVPLPIHYLVGSLQLFAPRSRLVVPGLHAATLMVDGHRVAGLEGEGLAAGTLLIVGVDGPPPSALPVLQGPGTLVPILSIGAFGGFALLLFAFMSRGAVHPDPLALQRRREGLIARIAGLDVAYEEGALSKTTYERRRAYLLDRLSTDEPLLRNDTSPTS